MYKKALIDASFLAKVLGFDNDPKIRTKSQQLISKSLLCAPQLIEYELGSIAIKYRDIIDIDYLFQAYQYLNVELLNCHKLSNIFKISRKHNLSFYDASYLEILQNDESIDVFLTYDRDFSRVKDERIRVF